jgi:hypothetical protein
VSYKIYVETINHNQLQYTNVDSYELKEGMVIFIDKKNGLKKIFSSSRCQIEEEAGDL